MLLESFFDIKVKDLLRPLPNPNQSVCPKASSDPGEGRESQKPTMTLRQNYWFHRNRLLGGSVKPRGKKRMDRWITEGEYATQPAALKGRWYFPLWLSCTDNGTTALRPKTDNGRDRGMVALSAEQLVKWRESIQVIFFFLSRVFVGFVYFN